MLSLITNQKEIYNIETSQNFLSILEKFWLVIFLHTIKKKNPNLFNDNRQKGRKTTGKLVFFCRFCLKKLGNYNKIKEHKKGRNIRNGNKRAIGLYRTSEK